MHSFLKSQSNMNMQNSLIYDLSNLYNKPETFKIECASHRKGAHESLFCFICITLHHFTNVKSKALKC